jgi:hypothetical protein
MALLFQAQNNVGDAVDSLQKYLSVEPSGAYSDNARASLEKIRATMGTSTPGGEQMPPTAPGINSGGGSGTSQADASNNGRNPL